MTAVMEQADATMGKIGQTGGATADNFTRLSVSGQNLTDSLKVLASNALDPVAESLANTADGATDAMGALDNGRSAWTNFLTILQEIDPEMKLVTSRYVDQQKANEDNTAAMEAANAVYRDSIEVQENFAESLGEGEKTAYQHTAAMVASEAAAIEAAHAYDLGADALGGITDRADLFAVAQQNVNSIIGESVDRFGEFDGAMGEMMSNLDSLLEDAALAQEVQDISSAFDEWAGSINAVSEASAVSTKESGDAKEEAQAQAQAISELKDSFASGAISFADYKQGIADLTAVEQEYIAISTSTKDSLLERDIALGKVTTSEINATTAAIEGKDALLLVKDALTQSGDAAAVAGDQIAATGSIISGLQDKTVTVNFVSNTSGFNAPDASSLLNSGGGVTTGGDVFGHHGLDMTVPPGFSEPSRPFMIGATSGEEVVITPKGQGRGGGGLTIESLVVNGSAGMDENMLADVVAQRIAAKFRAASAGMGAS
ncbi:MAG: hypothetical protein GY927_10860 [bacterium]|nr:hypothetical protein [bacterium]